MKVLTWLANIIAVCKIVKQNLKDICKIFYHIYISLKASIWIRIQLWKPRYKHKEFLKTVVIPAIKKTRRDELAKLKIYLTEVANLFPIDILELLAKYTFFFIFVREYVSYLLMHFYIIFLLLALSGKYRIRFTLLEYSTGSLEIYYYFVVILIILYSYTYYIKDSTTETYGDISIFSVAKILKIYIGVIFFKSLCYGTPLSIALKSNLIFTFEAV